ncbi:hypothetical protein N802_18465 [Knoellia sinensis KCTC 19936]|uniref:Uncharacterized protein n=1 Tax=Knoellia sinensis KCTC 19936 TaxID=1385520 RepID=A0A0A0J6E0_9MICO|nr:hypothetical protein N802_18465 [Knoellia sinensis KCTC 19936]
MELRSRTESAGADPTILPYFLAQTITGSQGSSVSACARAAWGAPAGVSLKAPITISQCEWDHASGSGTNYAAAPVYGSGNPWGYGGSGQPALPLANEVRLYIAYNSMDPGNPCENWNGHDNPGAFSYLEGSGCSSAVSPPLWIQGKPGNNWPSVCGDPAPLLGKVIDIPVHYCMANVPGSSSPSGTPPSSSPLCGQGSGQTWYYVKGWAKFYLSGYKVSGTGHRINGGTESCNGGGSRCLAGWFVSGVINTDTVVAPVPGDNDFGSIGVVPAG